MGIKKEIIVILEEVKKLKKEENTEITVCLIQVWEEDWVKTNIKGERFMLTVGDFI